MTNLQPDRSFSKRAWLMPALIMLIAVGLYLPTVGYDFVNWDDPYYVIDNPLIKSWSPANLRDIATQPVARNYAPLTQLSLLIDHTIWGLNPSGYHLTNILIHAMNVGLVFLLVRQLSGSYFVAWTTALLFATHPVQIETVAWVSSRKSLLSATFMLASLIYWLRSDRTKRHELFGTAWLFAALLTKAIAVCVPPIVLAYDVFVRKQSFRESLARQVVPGLAAAWLLLMTMSAQVTIVGGTREHFHLDKIEILALDAVILWKYVGMLITPTDLSVMYDVPTTGMSVSIRIAIAAWIGVWVFAWQQRRRRSWFLFSMIAFFVLFLPVLNLFPLTTLMNDRYLYLPSIIAFGLFSTLLFTAGRRVAVIAQSWSQRRMASLQAANDRGYWIGRAFQGALAGAAMTACVLATTSHLPVWKNGHSLWEYSSRQTPHLTVVQIQWANTLHAEGRTHEAIRVLERALQVCTPDDIDRKRIRDAITEWSGALEQQARAETDRNSLNHGDRPKTARHARQFNRPEYLECHFRDHLRSPSRFD